MDGLRGVAVLVVLGGHLHLFPGGFLGVDVFFVLSGFLITTLLLEERERTGGISLRRFFARRALRLFPALAAVLLVGLVYTSCCLTPEAARGFRREALVAALYVANWPKLHGTPTPTLGHTWSLSLEEQFYLVWPLVLCVLLWVGARRRTILACVVSGIVGSCALRFLLHQSYRATGTKNVSDITRLYMGLDTRADALLVGCLIGLLAVWNQLPTGRGRHLVATGAVAALGAFVLQVATRHLGHPQYYDGQFTLVALGLGAILIHLLVNPARVWRWVLEFPLLVGVGRISYGLYLVHMPLIRWFLPDGLQRMSLSEKFLVGGASFVAALALYYLVERPFLRLKTRSWASAVPSTDKREAPTPPLSLPARKAA